MKVLSLFTLWQNFWKPTQPCPSPLHSYSKDEKNCEFESSKTTNLPPEYFNTYHSLVKLTLDVKLIGTLTYSRIT